MRSGYLKLQDAIEALRDTPIDKHPTLVTYVDDQQKKHNIVLDPAVMVALEKMWLHADRGGKFVLPSGCPPLPEIPAAVLDDPQMFLSWTLKQLLYAVHLYAHQKGRTKYVKDALAPIQGTRTVVYYEALVDAMTDLVIPSRAEEPTALQKEFTKRAEAMLWLTGDSRAECATKVAKEMMETTNQWERLMTARRRFIKGE